MKNGKLQIGIIGCGGISNQKHMPNLHKLADLCEMVAFCDLIEERAQKARADFGAPDAKVYTDYQELIKDPEIDLVHVLTPNVSHCPISVAAFEAGKHVMCEKPMAASSADAKKMIDAWKKSGKKFTVGYQNRFRPEVQALHKACQQGELGEIYYAKAHTSEADKGFMKELIDNAWYPKLFGFTPDSSSVSTQVAAISNVYDQYFKMLTYGDVNPDEYLPQFLDALEAAGINDVIAEYQRQADAWLANN